MTAAELQAIRQRDAQFVENPDIPCLDDSGADRRKLLLEVERLQFEIDVNRLLLMDYLFDESLRC